VVTALNQPFQDGIVLMAGAEAAIILVPGENDTNTKLDAAACLSLGGQLYTGITAWKEDLQETALLQENQSAEQNRSASDRRAAASFCSSCH